MYDGKPSFRLDDIFFVLETVVLKYFMVRCGILPYIFPPPQSFLIKPRNDVCRVEIKIR